MVLNIIIFITNIILYFHILSLIYTQTNKQTETDEYTTTHSTLIYNFIIYTPYKYIDIILSSIYKLNFYIYIG